MKGDHKCMESKENLGLFVGILFLLTSLYSLFVGISFQNKQSLGNTKIYEFGRIVSNLVQGKKKTDAIDNELKDSKNSAKYAFFFFSFVFCVSFFSNFGSIWLINASYFIPFH